MENNSEPFFDKLKDDVAAYAELKLELFKLNTYERTGKVIASLSYGLVLLFLVFFAILFIFLALGFFLEELFDVSGLGFASVASLYLLMIWLLKRNKDKIRTAILNDVIVSLTTNDEKNNTTNDEPATNPTGETDF